MSRIALPEEEEKKRKLKMTKRLSFLFILIDFILVGIIIFELLQYIKF